MPESHSSIDAIGVKNSLDMAMKKILVDLVVGVIAVFVGLFLYDHFRIAHPAAGPSVGAAQDRTRMLQSDFQRAVGAVETAAATYYANHGTWPANNEDAGLPPPDTYRGESLVRLELMGPIINLTFDAKSGIEGGRITLNGEPTPKMAMGIHWGCISNIADIAAIIPNCRQTLP